MTAAPHHDPAVATPDAIVATTRTTVATRRQRTWIAAAAMLLVATGLGLLVADALFACSAGVRWLLGHFWLALVPLAGVLVVAIRNRLAPAHGQAVRLAETALADHDRRLTTAMQLAVLGEQGDRLAAAGAQRFAHGLDAVALPARLPPSRAFAWITALAFFVLAAALVHGVLPDLFPTTAARFRHPEADLPPFSLTKLAFSAGPDRVRVGAAARFEVTVAGRPAAQLVLVACATTAGPLAAPPWSGAFRPTREVLLPMFQVGPSTWAAELTEIRAGAWICAEGGGTRTRYRLLEVDPVPVLAAVDLRLEAPAYAGLEPEQLRLAPGAPATLAALPRSRLILRPSANRELGALLLWRDDLPADRPADRLELTRDGTAELRNLEPGSYRVAAVARADGLASEPLPGLTITARVDQPPRAAILQPSRDAVATPSMLVPFVAEADDDLGLISLTKVRAANGLEAPELVQAVHGRTVRWSQPLDLSQLGVVPGDALVLGLIARDSRPETQTSALVQRTIQVISEATFNRLVRERLPPDALAQKYAGALRDLRNLERRAAELRRLAPEMTKEQVAAHLAKLATDARALEKQINGLRRDHPLFKVEPFLQDRMGDKAAAIAKTAEAGDVDRLPRDGLAEELAADLETVALATRTNRLLARLRQIIDAQQNTAKRLAPLAEPRRLSDTDRVRLRDLAEQEERIASQVGLWLADEKPLAAAMRPAFAEDADRLDAIAAYVTAEDISNLLGLAAAAARTGDGAEAHRQATIAAERLARLLGGNEGKGKGKPPPGGLAGMQNQLIAWSLLMRGVDANCLADAMGTGEGMGSGIGQGSWSYGSGWLMPGFQGDDFGGSDLTNAMAMFGPEQFQQWQGTGEGDRPGLADLAAGGQADGRAAAGFRRALRSGTTAERSRLSDPEARLVGDYFRAVQDRATPPEPTRQEGPTRSPVPPVAPTPPIPPSTPARNPP